MTQLLGHDQLRSRQDEHENHSFDSIPRQHAALKSLAEPCGGNPIRIEQYHAARPMTTAAVATFRNKDFIPASEALVRKDWKYMYWPEDDVEQLFNLKNDPREENDLAGDPGSGKKLAEMRKRFQELKEAVK